MLCPICMENEATHTHHIFQGSRRKMSEQYKEYCTIKLCPMCHRKIHDGKLKAFDLMFKQKAQKRFEADHGGGEDGHKMWMSKFRKNYL